MVLEARLEGTSLREAPGFGRVAPLATLRYKQATGLFA